MIINKLLIACVLALVFCTGFLTSYLANSAYINKESPFLIGFGSTKLGPGNWISEDKILVDDNKVCIYVKNAVLSEYADSGSMLPTLGEYANGIKIVPENPEQIKIGDIISFQQGNIMIVHRVVDKGQDKNGYWFVTKGDNNLQTDGKVYWKDIKYVTVGLIY